MPVNYRSLELNEALIDWLTGGGNYNQVVVAAGNEAGGQGFVTERAGPADAYENVVVTDFERGEWELLQLDLPVLSSEEVLNRSTRFAQWDGYLDVLEDFLPDDELDAFVQCPRCDNPLTPFNTLAFMDALSAEVVEPMLETSELMASLPYVTRFYTTLSAPEMDLDPLFDFNPDLEDVNNVHGAERVIECDPSIPFSDAPSRIELEDGRVVRLPPGARTWPWNPDEDGAPPANAIVAQLSTNGPGTVVTDNSAAIEQALRQHNATVPSLDSMGLTTAGGCSVTSNPTGFFAWLGLALAGLLRLRRPKGHPPRT